MNFNEYQPDLPFLEWNKERYTAIPEIFYPTTRERFLKIVIAIQDSKDIEKKQKHNKDFVELMEYLYPGTEKARWFKVDNNPLPDWVRELMADVISAKILNYPWVPEGLKYSHPKAEKLLFAMVAERAKKFSLTTEQVLEEVEKLLEKK